jgi:hypothetical protein
MNAKKIEFTGFLLSVEIIGEDGGGIKEAAERQAIAPPG